MTSFSVQYMVDSKVDKTPSITIKLITMTKEACMELQSYFLPNLSKISLIA